MRCAISLFGLMIILSGVSTVAADPVCLDLTTKNSSGFVNDGFFQQTDFQPSGTGVIRSFVRIQEINIEQGYNTDHRPVQFDEKTDSNFTRSLLLTEVPLVLIGGVPYRQFLLDINEPSSVTKKLLDLVELKIFRGTNPMVTGYNEPADTFETDPFAVKVYDLDTLVLDCSIRLDAKLNPGSGKADMWAYIPEANFLLAPDNPYVYLYSKFGALDSNGDPTSAPTLSEGGFEEWAVIPLPKASWSGAALFLALLTAAVIRGRIPTVCLFRRSSRKQTGIWL